MITLFEREISAGGIVIKGEGSGVKVLLIKDSYGRWTWPKGKLEKRESPEGAALREVEEEVGLNNIKIIKRLDYVNYFYRRQGKLIFKTVTVYLFKAEGDEKLRIQLSEIQDGRWFPPEEALRIISYKGAAQILKKALALLP